MAKLLIGNPPVPNREKFPFTASIRYRGMAIDIENLDGSFREGTSPGGKKWRTKFKGAHYGELRGSKGTDGDALDIYIKAQPDDGANKAYIVHQNFPRNHPTKGGQFDEDKVVLGVSSAEEAKALYLRHYNRKDFFRSITEMPIEAFKRYAFGENKGEKVAEKKVSLDQAKVIGKEIGIDWDTAKFPVEEFRRGIEVEQEHGTEYGPEANVGGDDLHVAARIALAHLLEIPDYYTRLDKMEAEALGKEANGDEGEEPGLPVRPGIVKGWLRRHPNPDDDQMHEFAEAEGYNVHDLEKYVYTLATKAVRKESHWSAASRAKYDKGVAAARARGEPTLSDLEKEHAASGLSPSAFIRTKMRGDGKMKKTAFDEAYEAGVRAALNEFMKVGTDWTKFPGSKAWKKKNPGPRWGAEGGHAPVKLRGASAPKKRPIVSRGAPGRKAPTAYAKTGGAFGRPPTIGKEPPRRASSRATESKAGRSYVENVGTKLTGGRATVSTPKNTRTTIYRAR